MINQIKWFFLRCRYLIRRIFNSVKAGFIRVISPLFLPIKNIIAFESIPDYSDNTKAVFDEMIRRGMNQKYQMIWRVNQPASHFPKIENVVYLNRQDPEEKKRWKRVLLRTKCLICCNNFLPSQRNKQFSFYLSHGTAVKRVRSYYTIPKKIDRCLIASERVTKIQSYELNFPAEKMVPLGFPRNDVLTQPPIDIRTPLHTNCKTIIVWYPTFRQHKGGSKTASSCTLPVLENKEAAMALNETAKANDILLVLKPHFAQDVSYVKDLHLSNIRFIDDQFFADHHISSYAFVAACDAMITDYSSIYFDYTLCDKPIAVVWEDLEEYLRSPGLIQNYEYYLKGAEKVYTEKELEEFIIRVSQGIDLLKEERREIRDLANISTDGKNAARVVDYIIEKAKL